MELHTSRFNPLEWLEHRVIMDDTTLHKRNQASQWSVSCFAAAIPSIP